MAEVKIIHHLQFSNDRILGKPNWLLLTGKRNDPADAEEDAGEMETADR